MSRKEGHLEQSDSVRKACHRTWAGEETALPVDIPGKAEVSEANKEEGSESSSFLLPFRSEGSLC